jgi:hypothetical protein
MSKPQNVIAWMLENPQRAAYQELIHVQEQIEYLERLHNSHGITPAMSLHRYHTASRRLLLLYEYQSLLKTELESY